MVRFEELGRESFLQAHLTRLLEEQWWEKQGQVCGQHPWPFWGVGAQSCTSILRGQDGTMAKSTGSGGRPSQLPGPALSFASCMTLSKWLKFHQAVVSSSVNVGHQW